MSAGKSMLDDYVSYGGYLRNVCLVTDKPIDPELDLWLRTVRDDVADVKAILFGGEP